MSTGNSFLQFNSSGSTDGLVISKAPAIDFSKGASDDFVSQLDQLTKKFQNEQQAAATTLKVDELGLTARVADAFDDPLERALGEARKLMAANQYRKALLPLTRALQEEPDHPEATYLMALCCTNLDQVEQALIMLLPLRRMPLDPELSERVQALKARIRSNMLLMVMLENMLLLRSNRAEAVIGRLSQLLQLDPDNEMYYYLLSGSLMTIGRLEQALQTAQTGIRECAPRQAELLENLKLQILDRLAAKQLESARDLVKKGQLSKAHDKVRALPRDLRSTNMARQFEKYLNDMERGSRLTFGGQGKTIAPGSLSNHKEMEPFHFFLVGDDTRKAGQLMQRNKFTDAEKVLSQAVAWAPKFPYVNYLYAICIFTRLLQQLDSRRKLAPDEVDSSLARAYNHAVIGAIDSEIQDASKLVEVLDQSMAQGREARLLGGLIQEFQSIMNGAKRGIRSPEQLTSVHSQMSQLRNRVQNARKEVRTSAAAQQLGALTEVVEHNYKKLEEMRGGLKEAEVVNRLSRQFVEHMEGIKKRHGLNYWEKDGERNFFTSLQSQALQAQTTLHSSDARKQLSDLINAISQVLKQLE